jgi:predicted protein tyrosine phosphatase
MNLLFICSKNKLRSPTGEEVFSEYDGIDAIGCGTNADAATPLSGRANALKVYIDTS